MALINGTKNIDVLVGTGSSDVIFDGDGSDTIVAGGGNDTIFNGKGGDFISGGDGEDLVSYALSDTSVTVNLATHVGKGGYAEGDILWEIENLTGSNFSDTLTGDANSNVIHGGEGQDVIHGGGGRDDLFGDGGDDTLFNDNGMANFNGGSGTDTADFSGREVSGYYYHPGGVYVNLAYQIVDYNGPNFHEWGPKGTIVDVENVNGTHYSDTLIGDYKNNVLNGNAGDDFLTGNGGHDIFQFSAHNGVVDFGNDMVTDFTVGEDRVRISHSAFANFGVMMQHTQQVGNDVVITYDADNSITLHNVQLASLHWSDFIFA